MSDVEFTNFDEMLDSVKGLAPMPTVVVDAAELHVLQGACEAAKEGLIDPILIGDKKKILTLLEMLDHGSQVPVIDVPDDAKAAHRGVDLVLKSEARALMKGHLHTDEFLHPILDHLRGTGRLSHIFIADLSTYSKLLYITDGAINITPDLNEKAQIIRNAVELARMLGVGTPKVAVLSAIEVVNTQIASSIDAACLAKMSERGQIRHAVVDGPLAFDNAISKESAGIKGIDSPVCGDVDILLAPDLVSANILAKDLEYLAGARMGGIVMGTRVPVILTSRADPPEARVLSCAIAALVDHRLNTGESSHSDR
jgi:phosphotransacetylase